MSIHAVVLMSSKCSLLERTHLTFQSSNLRDIGEDVSSDSPLFSVAYVGVTSCSNNVADAPIVIHLNKDASLLVFYPHLA